jgi:hypothetical protein
MHETRLPDETREKRACGSVEVNFLSLAAGMLFYVFSLKLLAHDEEEIVQIATSAQSSIRMQLRKQEEHFWAPLSAACQDLSFHSFIEQKPVDFTFNFETFEGEEGREEAQEGEGEGAQHPTSDSPPQFAADQGNPHPDQSTHTDLRRTLAQNSFEISNLCDQADEFCLLVPGELPTSKLTTHIKDLSSIIANIQTLVKKATTISAQLPQDQRQELAHLTKPQQRLLSIIEMKNQFAKAKEAKAAKLKKETPKKQQQAEQAGAMSKTPVDFMFKVKSIFPSDDVSDQMTGTSLLSLFIVIPIPHSTVSLYHSIIQASCNTTIISEMEAIFKRKLESTKELACEIHRLTRSQFSKVQDCPMVRGGKTFREYLSYKSAKSWDEIASDHILGEVSLCSQIWKLNIAVIWRHENVWRLFISVNGSTSPILPLLYSKMKYVLGSDGFPLFCAGTAGRFFPLCPTQEEWYLDETFIPSIPSSLPEDEEHQEITAFNRRVDKESLFAATVQVDDTVSSDESSIVTADHASELLMSSFIDNEGVSQGSLPTPPEIKAIPLRTQCGAVNLIASIPLRHISAKRRRRIIESSASPPAHQPPAQKPPDLTGTGGDGANSSA